jgi:integrase
LHHAVLSGALKSAVKKKLVSTNVCTMVDWRPQATKSSDLARAQAWTADEARRFLAVALDAGTQWGAFFALAIDSGMRRGELCGPLWKDVDLNESTVTVHQLIAAGVPVNIVAARLGHAKTSITSDI